MMCLKIKMCFVPFFYAVLVGEIGVVVALEWL